jgi:hypothetical protein
MFVVTYADEPTIAALTASQTLGTMLVTATPLATAACQAVIFAIRKAEVHHCPVLSSATFNAPSTLAAIVPKRAVSHGLARRRPAGLLVVEALAFKHAVLEPFDDAVVGAILAWVHMCVPATVDEPHIARVDKEGVSAHRVTAPVRSTELSMGRCRPARRAAAIGLSVYAASQ